jgi:hypothetical protein
MPSPFPGMNPYLEHSDVWHDFHESFLPRVRDRLVAQLGRDYVVKLEQHLYVEELSPQASRTLSGRSDVSVAEKGTEPNRPSGAAALLESPVEVIPLLVDEFTECYVEIHDRQSRKLITVIELLSPANKTGSDRNQYLAKRDQILKSTASLVEIDLLRAGERLPFQWLPPCDYYIMVSRQQHRPGAQFWPLMLRDPLPTIPIPLRATDADARLDLQQVLHETYDAAGYENYIYENAITPPLGADDARWAEQLVDGGVA